MRRGYDRGGWGRGEDRYGNAPVQQSLVQMTSPSLVADREAPKKLTKSRRGHYLSF